MNMCQCDQAIAGLKRIRDRLFQVERATARKRTPGRVAEIEQGDDLSGWDATRLRMANEIGVNLSLIGARAQATIENLMDEWK